MEEYPNIMKLFEKALVEEKRINNMMVKEWNKRKALEVTVKNLKKKIKKLEDTITSNQN